MGYQDLVKSNEINQIIALKKSGLTTSQIANDLSIPVAAVKMVIADSERKPIKAQDQFLIENMIKRTIFNNYYHAEEFIELAASPERLARASTKELVSAASELVKTARLLQEKSTSNFKSLSDDAETQEEEIKIIDAKVRSINEEKEELLKILNEDDTINLDYK